MAGVMKTTACPQSVTGWHCDHANHATVCCWCGHDRYEGEQPTGFWSRLWNRPCVNCGLEEPCVCVECLRAHLVLTGLEAIVAVMVGAVGTAAYWIVKEVATWVR